MNIDSLWNKIIGRLADEKELSLPRGKNFKASFDKEKQIITIVPTKTGIPRTITKEEWTRVGNKFNQVKKEGYEPLRPGHYARISHNSSYIVAILKEYGNSE